MYSTVQSSLGSFSLVYSGEVCNKMQGYQVFECYQTAITAVGLSPQTDWVCGIQLRE